MIKVRLFLVFFSFLFFLLLLTPIYAVAKENFYVDYSVFYDIDEQGKTKSKIAVTITNSESEAYSTSFLLTLQNINPQNVKVLYNSAEIPVIVDSANDNSTLRVNFDDKVVGAGKTRNLTFLFDVDNFAQKIGDVWEISIPKISNIEGPGKYSLYLSIPKSFGFEAYSSPNPTDIEASDDKLIYKFDKDQIKNTGITLGFGNFQVFSFTLNYHLENPLRKKTQIEIALPPDTSTQKLYYDKISPSPDNVRLDIDGNWLAAYELKPRERLDVQAIGSVQIFTGPRKIITFSQQTLNVDKKETAVWQTNDQKIKELAEELQTPRQIYDYVKTHLKYDYNRIQQDSSRLGALSALNDPTKAICTEFTDLFIALARAGGIPAREINGYAYTENPVLQPLSLVADVLHSWPEYYSEDQKTWIPVDPTWGSTSGVDYFSKLDLRHFAFVIHGENYDTPYSAGSYKLGSNPQKDVFVNLGTLPQKRLSEIEIESQISGNTYARKVNVKFKNPGPTALYNVTSQIVLDDKSTKEMFFEVVPPYSIREFDVPIQFSFLAKSQPETIRINVGNKELVIRGSKNYDRLVQLLSFFLTLFIILFFILYKLGKLRFIKRLLFFKR